MKRIGYARVSTSSQSSDGQVEQLRAAGCGRVVQETASGAKTSRASLTHRLPEAGRHPCGDEARPTGPVYYRPSDDPQGGGRPQSLVSVPWRAMGRYHDRSRSADADDLGWSR